MCESTSIFQISKFGINTLGCQPANDSSLSSETVLNFTINLVVQSWYRWENSWWQFSDIFSQFQGVSCVETTFHSWNKVHCHNALLERVSCWEIWDIAIVMINWLHELVQWALLGSYLDGKWRLDQHLVGQFDTLWISCGSWSIWECGASFWIWLKESSSARFGKLNTLFIQVFKSVNIKLSLFAKFFVRVLNIVF